ncbi:protease inhibitor I42 family protein [Methanosphaerula subterraneus]|uniref:protease inhibitor I42 family protein n=1 Tax=Methanosphaerula subterraneus TaxID=3350244 RepID=UPI003F825209
MKSATFMLALLVTGLLLTAGCTGQSGNNTTTAPANSSLPVMTGTITGEKNTTSITLPAGTTTTIELQENPTTGYAWNVTLSSGLAIENNTYIPDSTSADRVGAGGTHQWVVRGVSAGEQTFSAVYKRPWEPVTGNERQFTEFITVT